MGQVDSWMGIVGDIHDINALVHNWKPTPISCPRCQASTYFLETPETGDWAIVCDDSFNEDCQWGRSYSLLECEMMLVAEDWQ